MILIHASALFGLLAATISFHAFAPPNPSPNCTALFDQAGGTTRPLPKSMPFPDLAAAMAKRSGLTRPPKPKFPELPPFENNDVLPRGVLFQLLETMGKHQNWRDVAYGASGHRTVEDKLRAGWMRDDFNEAVREYFAQLNEVQRNTAKAAFAGGMADLAVSTRTPDDITLEWVKTNYPPREGLKDRY